MRAVSLSFSLSLTVALSLTPESSACVRRALRIGEHEGAPCASPRVEVNERIAPREDPRSRIATRGLGSSPDGASVACSSGHFETAS